MRGGVCPLSFCAEPAALDGELRRKILSPGALLGVSRSGFGALVDRLKRGASLTWSYLGGDEGTPSSARSAWVTLENLMAGGGSSSESLSSPTLIRFIIGASAEKPLDWLKVDNGEFRLICGRVGWATAAMTRLTVCLTQPLMGCVWVWCSIPDRAKCSSRVVSECGWNPAVLWLSQSSSLRGG